MFRFLFLYISLAGLALLILACSELNPDTSVLTVGQCNNPYDPQYATSPQGSGLNDTATFKWGNDKDSGNYSREELNNIVLKEEWRNQDMDNGRDSIEDICKIGGGFWGRDYSKVDADGKLLPQTALFWECVLDNHTGLLWYNEASSAYTNSAKPTLYSKISTLYGPDEDDPQQSGYKHSAGLEIKQDYNAEGICGRNNWDIPSVNQLISLRALGYQLTIDRSYFTAFVLNKEPMDPFTYTDSIIYSSKSKQTDDADNAVDVRVLCKESLDKLGVNGAESKRERDEFILNKNIGICNIAWDKILWSKEQCENNKYFVLSTLEGIIKCRYNTDTFALPSEGAGIRMLHKLVAPLTRDEHQAILNTL